MSYYGSNFKLSIQVGGAGSWCPTERCRPTKAVNSYFVPVVQEVGVLLGSDVVLEVGVLLGCYEHKLIIDTTVQDFNHKRFVPSSGPV